MLHVEVCDKLSLWRVIRARERTHNSMLLTNLAFKQMLQFRTLDSRRLAFKTVRKSRRRTHTRAFKEARWIGLHSGQKSDADNEFVFHFANGKRRICLYGQIPKIRNIFPCVLQCIISEHCKPGHYNFILHIMNLWIRSTNKIPIEVIFSPTLMTLHTFHTTLNY